MRAPGAEPTSGAAMECSSMFDPASGTFIFLPLKFELWNILRYSILLWAHLFPGRNWRKRFKFKCIAIVF
jgi:hypothetical protein